MEITEFEFPSYRARNKDLVSLYSLKTKYNKMLEMLHKSMSVARAVKSYKVYDFVRGAQNRRRDHRASFVTCHS